MAYCALCARAHRSPGRRRSWLQAKTTLFSEKDGFWSLMLAAQAFKVLWHRNLESTSRAILSMSPITSHKKRPPGAFLTHLFGQLYAILVAATFRIKNLALSMTTDRPSDVCEIYAFHGKGRNYITMYENIRGRLSGKVLIEFQIYHDKPSLSPILHFNRNEIFLFHALLLERLIAVKTY
ncbi:LAFA_0F13806g1_1 [Lachancea sp. 'fantastica']|nr:LAFA_0F13806g1_1 [Lachancea sp. 'fantastica']